MTDYGRHLLDLWLLDPDVAYLNHGTVGVTPKLAHARLGAADNTLSDSPRANAVKMDLCRISCSFLRNRGFNKAGFRRKSRLAAALSHGSEVVVAALHRSSRSSSRAPDRQRRRRRRTTAKSVPTRSRR